MSSEGDQATEESTNKFFSYLNGYIFTKLTSYYVLTMLYLLLGGLIFHLVEGENERREREEAIQEMDNLNSTIHSFLMSTNVTLSNQQLSTITSYIVELSTRLSSVNSIIDRNPRWTYGQSVYFSFIAITTIGYGQLAPTTITGQALLCLYAFLGIPIFVLLITETSRRLTEAFDWCVLHRVKQEKFRWIVILIVIIIGVVTMIFIPAAIFGSMEGWAYATAAYFCFVSLSTIGYGDFVIGTNPNASYSANTGIRDFYVLSSLIWLFLGLAFIGILVSQIGTGIEKLENHISELFKRLMKRKYDIKHKDDSVKKRKGTETELLPSSNLSP